MLVTFGNVAAPIRPVIGFLFLLACPGMAVVGLLRMRDGVAEWTLTVAASLAIDALVAGSMAYARAWSPEGGLVVLVGFSLAGALLQLVRNFSVRSAADEDGVRV
jgi:hypothetical protein